MCPQPSASLCSACQSAGASRRARLGPLSLTVIDIISKASVPPRSVCLSVWGQWPGPTLATLGWAPFPPLRAAHRAAPAPGLTVGVTVGHADVHGWLNRPNVSMLWRWRRALGICSGIGGVTAGGIKKKFQQIPQPRRTRFTSGPADSLFHAIRRTECVFCRHTLHLLYAWPTATPTQGPPAPIRGLH